MRTGAIIRAGLVLLAATTGGAGSEAPLAVEEIAPGVFVHAAPIALAGPANAGAIANLGFVIGSEAVAVVDTGGSLQAGRRLLAAVRGRTPLPVRYVINTHVHPDHVLGNAAFRGEPAAFVGHPNLAEALAARGAGYLVANGALIGAAFAGTAVVPPTMPVDGPLTLDLGGRTLRLEAWGTGHTNTDVTVLDEATGTWFLGDLLFVRHVPALDGRLKGWLATIAQLRRRPAARAVPGHGPASVPWPSAAAPLEAYLGSLQDQVRQRVAEGKTLTETTAEVGALGRGAWLLTEDFGPRNATTAYQEIEWE